MVKGEQIFALELYPRFFLETKNMVSVTHNHSRQAQKIAECLMTELSVNIYN